MTHNFYFTCAADLVAAPRILASGPGLTMTGGHVWMKCIQVDGPDEICKEVRDRECTRAVLVGHNAHFDLGFLNEAVAHCEIKRSPFHPFAIFDTASLAAVALGQTVLARAAQTAGLAWDEKAAHNAAYDAEVAADLFCGIVNRFRPVYEALPPAPAPPEPDAGPGSA